MKQFKIGDRARDKNLKCDGIVIGYAPSIPLCQVKPDPDIDGVPYWAYLGAENEALELIEDTTTLPLP